MKTSSLAETHGREADRWRAVGLAAVLIAFLLRLYDISGPSLRGDEAFTVTFARQDVPAMIPTLLEIETQPPFYYAGMHYWMLLAGESELALRLSSLLAGVGLVALLFRLGRLTTGRARCGALAAVLAAINPYMVWHSQDARMYSLYVAACTLTLILALGIWRRQAAGQIVGGGSWAGYASAAVLSLYAHYWAVLAFVGLNLGWLAWLWLQSRRGCWPGRTAVLSWLLAQAFATALYVPWLIQAAPMLSNHAKLFITPVSLADVFQRTAVAFSVGQTGGAWALPFASVFAAVALVGAVFQARRSPPATVALLVFLAVPLVGAYALSQVRPVYEERYVLGVAGAYLVLLAWGLCALWPRAQHRVAPRVVATVFGVALIGMSFVSLYNHYFVPEYRKSPGWRETVQFIVAQAKPGDLVIENTPDPSLTYYLDDKMDLTVQPSAAPVDPAQLERDLRQLAAKYRRAWFLPDVNPAWDGDGAVMAWLDRNGERLSQSDPGGLTVILYELSRP